MKGIIQVGQGLAAGERPTLKTIAFMTGLGVTTVSRALKDAPDIGQETKERVRLVATQIGYHPNRAGVRLRTGKTNVISLILNIDEELMGLTSHIVYGISEVLSATNYHLIVTPYSRLKDPMDPVRYILDTGSADGVILSSTQPDDPRVRLLLERNLPFSTHGRTNLGLIHPYHDFDNEAYAYEAVRRLVEKGRRRLAILEPSPQYTFYQHMNAGFHRGLRDFGAIEIPFGESTIHDTMNDIHQATMHLLKEANELDGIVAGSSAGAVAIASAIEKSGRRLGGDIDMVSKQPANLLHFMRPEIMTVDEDIRLAGRELAKAVLARIEGVPADQLRSVSLPDGRLVYPG
ncbi:LacI family transcriptional regulator [Rhizobium setariae]|nr:LacI family transcriptional regulator [Rhizobium setariae]